MGNEMRTCKCEHWEVCPVCKPNWFDSEGNRLPPEPTPLQAANGVIESLRQQLAHREAQIVGLRDAALGLSRGVDWNHGTHAKIYRPALLRELAATDDLSGYILCDREPVAWLNNGEAYPYPEGMPLYRAKEQGK